MTIETFDTVIRGVAYAIGLVGVFVVVWGATEALYRFFALKLDRQLPNAQVLARIARIREQLGGHLLFALDLFVGADIIRSVVAPSWENIAMLGAIVLVRIVLTYFLQREMEHTHQSAQSGRLSGSDPPGSNDSASGEAVREPR